MAMSVTEQMSLADVKNWPSSDVVDRLDSTAGSSLPSTATLQQGLTVDDLESVEETLDVMENAALLGDIRESHTELADTQAAVLRKDEALRLSSDQ